MLKKGIFIVLSGPSGVGKDTIADILINKGYGIYSVSMTTRKKRNNEVEGKDYFFVTSDIFESNIENNNFLEYAMYNDNYYGTLKSFVFNNIDNGTNVIAIVDIQGGMNIEKLFPEAVLIFIMPPSFEELERRLRRRGTDSEEAILKRLSIAKKEMDFSSHYDYVVVNNTVDECINDIVNIIDKEVIKINETH
ncbi:MAG: guanylate kinase [Bacilli bacterium]|nr:guanylate kinase [Bacilli bacterium]